MSINNNCGGRYINFSVIEKAKALKGDGYNLVLHRFKSNGRIYFYIKARKTINGKRKEITVARVSQKEAEELERMGLISKKRGRKSKKDSKKVYKGKSESPNNNTTTSAPPSETNDIKNFADSSGGVGGHDYVLSCQSLMIHRIGLRFERPWVSQLYLHSVGEVEYVERSKQYIVRKFLGKKRVLTLQVNSNGTAQVFLEASDNPLTVEEFIGFCKFYLLELFRGITGREVSLSDFRVIVAPEFNVDLNGVILEGVKCVTLDEYCEELVRIYQCDPMEKETMPNGGTRVEVRANSFKGLDLSSLVDGVVSSVRLSRDISEIKRTLEEIKGHMALPQIEIGVLADAIATRIANVIWALFEKYGGSYELALREFAKKLEEVLSPLVQSVNSGQQLQRGYSGSNSGNGSSRVMTLDDLPIEFARFLGDLDEAGYVRIMYDKIMYGDKTWQAIRYFRGNIDGFIEEASYEFVDGKRDLRDLFKAVMKAIRFYDNKFNGSVGVPWDRFVSALERFYGKKLEEIEKELRRGL